MRRVLRNLVFNGLVSDDSVNEIIARVGERNVQRELLDSGMVTEEQFAKAVSAAHQIPYADLANIEIEPGVLATVSAELCRRHLVLPIAVQGANLTLAMANPNDVMALDDVISSTGMQVRTAIVTNQAMAQALDRYMRLDTQIAEVSSELDDTPSTIIQTAETLDDDDDDAPVVRFVNLIVSQAIQDRASDIHIDPTENNLRVRYRIDGVLKDVQSAPTGIMSGVISRLKIMSGIDIADKRRPQDGRLSVLHNHRTIDLRVATLPTVWGEKIVMRILDNSSSRLKVSDLQLSQSNLETFQSVLNRPHGMLLVTGPTGSGKSTTLYTALGEVARPEINAITVEDPVEYRMEGVSQMQVNSRAGLTFASALRSILRGDPDVVLVGEIRDRETAKISVEAALTGHLVLSTLHTNDAPSAITRLVEMGIEPFLVSSALDAVVAQRLARRLCQACRVLRAPDRAVVAAHDWHLPDGAVVGEPVGCPKCSGTGYQGRIALHEIMRVSEEIERLGSIHASSLEVRRAAIEEGMIPLQEDGWHKVLAGLTSIEEVLRVSA